VPAGALPATTYDLVLILTDTDGTRRSEALQLLTRNVYTTVCVGEDEDEVVGCCGEGDDACG
jgi:hypothetical protein